MKTLVRNFQFDVQAAPERVFPLLCPTLEHRWLAHWRCELLHSLSGFAEENCVFRTQPPRGGPLTWVVSRYEPSSRIEFTCVCPNSYVFRLKIGLEGRAESTFLDWTRTWIPLGPDGDAWLAGWTEEEYQKSSDYLCRAMRHYLGTGQMLQP